MRAFLVLLSVFLVSAALGLGFFFFTAWWGNLGEIVYILVMGFMTWAIFEYWHDKD